MWRCPSSFLSYGFDLSASEEEEKANTTMRQAIGMISSHPHGPPRRNLL